MIPGLTLLLGFVFALEQRTWAHSGFSSHLSIWAVPGAVISMGGSVSFFCRVPPGVTKVRLFHGEPGGKWCDRHPEGAQDVVNFSLPQVTYLDAGSYYCDYWKQDMWTERSESLQLAVTGVYRDQPSLTAHPAAQVALGGNVTLQCQLVYRYDFYIFCRDREDSFLQDCSHQSHSSFLISYMSLDHAGTYTCYGSPKRNPQLWSLPSNPLLLSVKRPDVPIAVVASAAAAAFLLLVLLFLLLLCLCRRQAKRRAAYDGTKGQMRRESSSPPVLIQGENEDHDLQDAKPEADRQRATQVPEVETAQEVTYAQLHPLRPGAGVDPLLPQGPEALSAQPCVYATLTLS